MNKYGVTQGTVKTSSPGSEDKCPECGRKPEREGNVLVCPVCGTKPWEEKGEETDE